MTIDFNSECQSAAKLLVKLSLEEDLRDVGDLTSLSTIPADLTATVNIVTRQPGVVCGLAVLPIVFAELSAAVTVETQIRDGDAISERTLIASLTGPVRDLLTGERTVLNFLTLLSGIASRTAQFVAEVHHTKAVILDTRKTFPGFRLLQKYAVRCGGGTNHPAGQHVSGHAEAGGRDPGCVGIQRDYA